MISNNINMDKQLKTEERIIQFGEGNFLRAFVDWMIQEMNDNAGFDSNVVVVQPIKNGLVDKLNSQNCLYHVVLKGIKNGKGVKDIKLNSAISRCINPYVDYQGYIKLAEIPTMRFIISNTTEAGIAFDENDKLEMQPPSSFPAKLTQLLYHRFTFYKGDISKGFIILPCELIENNANELKACIYKYCVLWSLPDAFKEWLEKSCTFCNTLVDRIVPGFNKDTALELANTKNIEDNMCVDAEQFHLWVIEGPQWVKNEFPTDKANLNVLYVNDVKPYRTRKVRLLNGPHTLMMPVAYLSGIEYVREAVEHPVIGKFILQAINNEIIPTLDLPAEELKSFADEVLDRFRNPFVNHALMSISLNSVSKFKSRLLPTLLDYNHKFGKLPENIVFSLAALIAFYKGEYKGKAIAVKDDEPVMQFFANVWKNFSGNTDAIVHETLKNEAFWGQNLTSTKGLEEKVCQYLSKILKDGMLESVKELVK
ncbi:MAG TPA: tagaturonate reductase [Bacteroidales bacterium]|nr:tagaturonate reductase [Bacteroidales bacterium]